MTVPCDVTGSPPAWSEAERLSALQRYGILDTPAEPEFDDITRVAALVCRAPIAAVSLVADTRQFLKAEVGLGIRETPIQVSFCARAILQSGLTVVPDARLDPRFAANPLVTGEPHLRFYAGAPLLTPDGLPLGTVCVLDTVPRPEGLTPEQAEILLALARQAMTQLELRRAVERHGLLSRELSHRIQNVFAVVGSLVSLTARNQGAAAGGFAEDFRQRLQALAQATEFVRPSSAEQPEPSPGQSLLRLLGILLAPYDARRVAVGGDDVPIGSRAATSLALAIHEMATNAIKYGALSTEGGRVAVACRQEGDDFALTWQERGGPAVPGPPTRQGFGTGMTVRSISGQLGGRMSHDWAPEGLTIRLVMPSSRLAV